MGAINASEVNKREINGPHTPDIANVKCGNEWGAENGAIINSFEINGPLKSNRERCRNTQVV